MTLQSQTGLSNWAHTQSHPQWHFQLKPNQKTLEIRGESALKKKKNFFFKGCFPLWYFKAQPLGISLGNQSRVTMSIWNCFYTDMRKPHSHVFNINEITISFPLEVFITLGKQMGKKCHAIRCWSSGDLDTSPPCWTSALLKQLYRHLGNTMAYAIFIIKH